MPRSRWLEAVADALRRQGLSTTYIRRFTDELAEHFMDLCQETACMDSNVLNARLGTPEELANRARVEVQRRTYAGRHPLITFVAAPLPAAALMLVGVCFSLVLVLSVMPEAATSDGSAPGWATAVMQAIVWTMRFVPFVAGAAVFCIAAKRAVCRPHWPFIACALIAVLAGLFAVNLTLPANGPGSGSLMVGFAVPPGPLQMLQAVAPFAVWLVLVGCPLRGRDTPLAA